MKDNAYQQDIVMHIMLLYVGAVNYNVNSNYMKYLAQRCCQNFAFFEKFRHKFANIVAPTTDGYAKCLVRFKVCLVP